MKPTAMDDEHMQTFSSIMMNRHGLDATHAAAIIGIWCMVKSKGNPTALERTDGTNPDGCKVYEHGEVRIIRMMRCAHGFKPRLACNRTVAMDWFTGNRLSGLLGWIIRRNGMI